MRSFLVVVALPFFVVGMALLVVGVLFTFPFCSAIGWHRVLKLSLGD